MVSKGEIIMSSLRRTYTRAIKRKVEGSTRWGMKGNRKFRRTKKKNEN
jgi:hypothetical protein